MASVEKVAFNPVKELELCSVSSDGTVKFWDIKTKALINEVKGLGETFTLAWAPDGETLVVGNKVWVAIMGICGMGPLTFSPGRYTLCVVTYTEHPDCVASADCAHQQHHVLLERAENLCHHLGRLHESS
jgi:hypothetical protein